MIASRFRSLWMVGLVAGAALSCYLVSQRVASERAALSRLDHQIVSTERDIRMLSSEVATRSRTPQLEKWNVAYLGLTAPGEHQFLDSDVRLATLDGRDAAVPQTPTVGTPDAIRAVSFTPGKPAPVVAGDDGDGDDDAVVMARDADKAGADAPTTVRTADRGTDRSHSAPQAPADQPLLRQATYVRPKVSSLAAQPAPIRASLTRLKSDDLAKADAGAKPAKHGKAEAHAKADAGAKADARTKAETRAVADAPAKAGHAKANRPVQTASLLPDDIGSLAAAERGRPKIRR